ncbi:MAG: hypothetical protein LBF76_00040 [Holosporales bacterium]|nr:hypothetical protein [Holosporales bacterium]
MYRKIIIKASAVIVTLFVEAQSALAYRPFVWHGVFVGMSTGYSGSQWEGSVNETKWKGKGGGFVGSFFLGCAHTFPSKLTLGGEFRGAFPIVRKDGIKIGDVEENKMDVKSSLFAPMISLLVGHSSSFVRGTVGFSLGCGCAGTRMAGKINGREFTRSISAFQPEGGVFWVIKMWRNMAMRFDGRCAAISEQEKTADAIKTQVSALRFSFEIGLLYGL